MINLEVCVKIKIMYNHYKDSKNLQKPIKNSSSPSLQWLGIKT